MKNNNYHNKTIHKNKQLNNLISKQKIINKSIDKIKIKFNNYSKMMYIIEINRLKKNKNTII